MAPALACPLVVLPETGAVVEVGGVVEGAIVAGVLVEADAVEDGIVEVVGADVLGVVVCAGVGAGVGACVGTGVGNGVGETSATAHCGVGQEPAAPCVAHHAMYVSSLHQAFAPQSLLRVHAPGAVVDGDTDVGASVVVIDVVVIADDVLEPCPSCTHCGDGQEP